MICGPSSGSGVVRSAWGSLAGGPCGAGAADFPPALLGRRTGAEQGGAEFFGRRRGPARPGQSGKRTRGAVRAASGCVKPQSPPAARAPAPERSGAPASRGRDRCVCRPDSGVRRGLRLWRVPRVWRASSSRVSSTSSGQPIDGVLRLVALALQPPEHVARAVALGHQALDCRGARPPALARACCASSLGAARFGLVGAECRSWIPSMPLVTRAACSRASSRSRIRSATVSSCSSITACRKRSCSSIRNVRSCSALSCAPRRGPAHRRRVPVRRARSGVRAATRRSLLARSISRTLWSSATSASLASRAPLTPVVT